MSAPRFGRIHKTTALVPLAVLSTAWTASLVGVGPATVAVASDGAPALPDGTAVPTEAIEAPATVSLPGAVAPAVPKGQAGSTVSDASTSGIPSAALMAYQRAGTVINSADKTCKIPWQLIAAIGRVESDHGRYGGNVLNDDGVATPGIYGIALDGSNNTQRITDTDAGQYDNDSKFDRAVGPMQFIPSTWSVVGVDGDNDGKRNPQDIDDAALATAVYLCSGNDNLSAEGGQRAAVFRYNHSNDYVDLVLSLMQAYMDGEYTAVPNSSTSAGSFTPDPTTPYVPAGRKNAGPRQGGGKGPQGSNGGNLGASNGGSSNGGSSNGGNNGGSGETQAPIPTPKQQNPIDKATEKVKETVKEVTKPKPLPSTGSKPVDEVLTRAQALVQCAAKGIIDKPLTAINELEQCVANLLK